MAKNKFKIGDMVIGNAKANEAYVVTRQGWIGKVTHTYPDGTISVKPTEDTIDSTLVFPTSFTVHSKYFDLYKPTKADSKDPNVLRGKANSSKRILIEVSKEDPTVIKAKYIRGKEYSNEEAYATCSKHDIFDFKTGAKIAFDRIMNVIEDIDGEEKHEEPEKLLNCRFVVTSGASGLFTSFHDGYIYTVRNGKILLGVEGFELPCTSGAFLKSQRDLEWYLGSCEDRDHMRELGTAPDKDDPLYSVVYNVRHRTAFKIIEGEVKG